VCEIVGDLSNRELNFHRFLGPYHILFLRQQFHGELFESLRFAILSREFHLNKIAICLQTPLGNVNFTLRDY